MLKILGMLEVSYRSAIELMRGISWYHKGGGSSGGENGDENVSPANADSSKTPKAAVAAVIVEAVSSSSPQSPEEGNASKSRNG
jgi:hypothetical protein